jgi:hypothetical protein
MSIPFSSFVQPGDSKKEPEPLETEESSSPDEGLEFEAVPSELPTFIPNIFRFGHAAAFRNRGGRSSST